MKATQNNKTLPELQIENALKRIEELSANVTENDRAAAATELGISRRTVARYEKERSGKNLDTAVQLFVFFRERIAAREKLLAS